MKYAINIFILCTFKIGIKILGIKNILFKRFIKLLITFSSTVSRLNFTLTWINYPPNLECFQIAQITKDVKIKFLTNSY